MSEEKLVIYEYDPDQPLTPEQLAELAALAARPDSEIDCSDIPPLDETFWKNAVRNPFYRPVKKQLTVRLDSDVLAWLKSAGRGYQTKLNAILRQAMAEDFERRRVDSTPRKT
jgi:uncharacterized protein (DUF4415 family)